MLTAQVSGWAGRVLRAVRRTAPTSASIRVVRTQPELQRTAVLLSVRASPPPAAGEEPSLLRRPLVLSQLQKLRATQRDSLYIQVDHARADVELVLTPHGGSAVIAFGSGFRVEATTEHTAPDGAYLTNRQYRRLGHYEQPPAEPALVAVRIIAGSVDRCLVDVPPHVKYVTAVINGVIVTELLELARFGQVRRRVA